MGLDFQQYDIYWVDLNPVVGSEISKTRPAVIISPDELNNNLRTIVVIPITSTIKNYLFFRINLISENVKGQIMLDQIRVVDKSRLKDFIENLSKQNIIEVKNGLKEIYCN